MTVKRKSLVIAGAGGFGRETLDVLKASDPNGSTWDFIGFVSDKEPDLTVLERIGTTWLGPIDSFLAMAREIYFVVAGGDPIARRLIANKFEKCGFRPAILIHPRAVMGADVHIGEGSIICSNVSITTNVRIGNHVHVNLNSTIGHDVRIADFVTINPLVAISGNVNIETDSQLGTHSAVLQGLRIGAGSVVVAGAAVTKDVELGKTVVGVPARPLPAN
jgi:sugar O-acyltransferase (sialic acid O-acetyltransferase NeuD family)